MAKDTAFVPIYQPQESGYRAFCSIYHFADLSEGDTQRKRYCGTNVCGIHAGFCRYAAHAESVCQCGAAAHCQVVRRVRGRCRVEHLYSGAVRQRYSRQCQRGVGFHGLRIGVCVQSGFFRIHWPDRLGRSGRCVERDYADSQCCGGRFDAKETREKYNRVSREVKRNC